MTVIVAWTGGAVNGFSLRLVRSPLGMLGIRGYNSSIDFAWDTEKAAGSLQKRHVSFEGARSVFDDLLVITHEDEGHSEAEAREFIVGHSHRGCLLLVCFTERQGGIRLISARQVTDTEQQDYAEYQAI